MKRILLITFSAFLLFFGFQQESETRTETEKLFQASELQDASARAIKLMQRSQAGWFQKQVCTSCHHQLLPEIPISLARTRGVHVDEKVAKESSASSFAYFKDLDAAVQGYDFIDTLFDGLSLTVAGVDGIKPSLSTSAYAQFIASRQLENGSWPTFDARPPQAHSLFTTTAVCAQAIRNYLPPRLNAEKQRRLNAARDWLTRTQPRTTEDRTFQLLGLHWTGAGEKVKAEAARGLLAEQREDGGWAQTASMSSDSYATGQALFALREAAGLATTDPAYQRGLRFLLKTQEPDGSWKIKSRLHPPAPVSPPYFDAGFPYEHDQFISITGTSWAVAAMLQALPELQWAKLKPAPSIDVAPAEQAEWMRVTLEGSAADLKKLLDRGMNPNSKTAAGTTALMLAARDPEKVKLLVERGADVNGRAATGLTPLMIAARFRGNVETVRFLLSKGARPNSDKGAEVRNGSTALFFAIMAGDAQTARALIDAGARVGDRVSVLGVFATSPLGYATFIGDAAMVEYLISKGANPNEVDDDGISPLGSAAIKNHANVVQVLLARGAQVNHVDKLGMTPLLYAASIDFGDTTVIERLIAAGADLNAKNKQGMTALGLASSYNHRAQVSLLADKTASR
ncbi:MAG TPA: ankyrin repeat domain-containing protein [Blastocatellia bacterium]|nr:ankyrin repeat domain-containing protein [Blastocatellia bacterium]